jgi:hypothetical protein
MGIQTLAHWWAMLVPDVVRLNPGVTDHLVDLLLAGLRWLVARWIDLILWLQMPAVQSAELRSDRAAAVLAGPAAYRALLERLRLSPRIERAAAQAAVRTDGADLYESIVEHVATLPPKELDRLGRLAAREPYVRALTHPPERLRLRALEGMGDQPPRVRREPAAWAQIDSELRPSRGLVEQVLRAEAARHADRREGVRPPRRRPGVDL